MPGFMDDITPTIVTCRDPRGYFYSAVNWLDRKTREFASGKMDDAFVRRYFTPEVLKGWLDLTFEEKLTRLINDGASRISFDAIIKATERKNCRIAKFEDFSPAKDPSLFGSETFDEYVRIFSHLGIIMDHQYVQGMLARCWGNSVTYSPNGVHQWSEHLSPKMDQMIFDRYEDVFERLGYSRDSRASH
jgi:hypothetical protein